MPAQNRKRFRFGVAWRCLLACLPLSACGAAQPVFIEPIVVGAVAPPAGRSTERPSIAVAAFDWDVHQADPFVVGQAKTGIGNAPAPVRSRVPGHQQVETVVRARLASWGFPLVDAATAEFVLHGAVRNFYVREFTNGDQPQYCYAFVRWEMFLADRGGRVVWAGTAYGTARSDVTILDTTYAARGTLAAATQTALSEAFAEGSFWDSLSAAAPKERI